MINDPDWEDALALLLPDYLDLPALLSGNNKNNHNGLTPLPRGMVMVTIPKTTRASPSPPRPPRIHHAPVTLQILCDVGGGPSRTPSLWRLAAAIVPPTATDILFEDHAKREAAKRERAAVVAREREAAHAKDHTHTPLILNPSKTPIKVVDAFAYFKKNIIWAKHRDSQIDKKRLEHEKEVQEEEAAVKKARDAAKMSRGTKKILSRRVASDVPTTTTSHDEKCTFTPLMGAVKKGGNRMPSPPRVDGCRRHAHPVAEVIMTPAPRKVRVAPAEPSAKSASPRHCRPEILTFSPTLNKRSEKLSAGRSRTPVQERHKETPRRSASPSPTPRNPRAVTPSQVRAYTSRLTAWEHKRHETLRAASLSQERAQSQNCTFRPAIHMFVSEAPPPDPDDIMDTDLREWFAELLGGGGAGTTHRRCWVPAHEVEREYRTLERSLGLPRNPNLNVAKSCGERVYLNTFLKMMREPVFRV